MNQEISIKTFLAAFWQKRNTCFLIVFVLTSAIHFYFLFRANPYMATTTIMNVDGTEGGGAMSGMAFAQLAGIPKMNDGFVRFTAILGSRSFSEQMVDVLGPDFFVAGKKAPASPESKRSEAVGIMHNSIKTRVEPDAQNVMKLSVIMKDPQKAVTVVNLIPSELQKYISRNSLTKAKRVRSYVEENIIETKAAIFETSQAIATFYSQFAVSPNKGMVETPLAKEIEVLKEKQAEFAQVDPILTPSIDFVKNKHETLQKRLESIQAIPEQSYFDYLKDEFAILKEINVSLRQQYEMAKLEEIKQEPALQVLDTAIGASRVAPSLWLCTFLAFLGSLCIAGSYVFYTLVYKGGLEYHNMRLPKSPSAATTS